MGETYNQHKQFLWDFIYTCRELIKAIQNSSLAESTLAREVIDQNRAIIRDTYAEIKELTRWFRASGLDEDEPYYPESYHKRIANLSEDEMDELLNKSEMLRQLQERG